MLFRREGGCFRCEKTPETRKRIVEHSFHKILHNAILWLLDACFKLPCVDNHGLTKVVQFIFTKTIKYHFNESRNPSTIPRVCVSELFTKTREETFKRKAKKGKLGQRKAELVWSLHEPL